MSQRQQYIEELGPGGEVSVLIVGGGINGCGLFRELALQGADVVLVDKGDFCCGASAGLSRMVHGGLRYLEFGEFGLVRESVLERNALLRNAPHYIAPLPTTIPLFKRLSGAVAMAKRFFGLAAERPPHRGSLLVRAGLIFYDVFTWATRMMPTHRFASRRRALARRPLLHPDTIGTATYYDAMISYAERLGLEMLLDGEAASGQARALNYVSLQGAEGNVVRLRDELTGRDLEIRPKILVNATGAWIDLANARLGLQTQLIGPTKGAHLVIDNEQLYRTLDGEMIYYETAEGRVSIVFPWLGKVLMGSTDIRCGDPDQVRCTEEEVDYMLTTIRQVLPDLEIGREHVVSRFTGVRPLRYSDSSATVSVSRTHHCEVIEPSEGVGFPVYAMAGGKWTTFRSFAEQVADALLARLHKRRRADSHDLPIGGGKGFPTRPDQRSRWLADLSARTHLPETRLDALLARYGTRAAEVAEFIAEAPDQPLRHHAGYSRREIEFLLARERVARLDDLLLRRTHIALLGELSGELLAELLALLAAARGWSQEQAHAEGVRVAEILRDRFGVAVPYPAGG